MGRVLKARCHLFDRMGVIMNVCLPEMLGLCVLVGLVVVFHGPVIVLVGMSGSQMAPLLPMAQIVSHVQMFVLMNKPLVFVKPHPRLLVRPMTTRTSLADSLRNRARAQ